MTNSCPIFKGTPPRSSSQASIWTIRSARLEAQLAEREGEIKYMVQHADIWDAARYEWHPVGTADQNANERII
jgi:hypothetical protein